MSHSRAYVGVMHHTDDPSWSNLTRTVGSRAEEFMWMFELRLDDGRVAHAYKHRMTRRYLYLADDGETLGWCGDDRYEAIDLAAVLPIVLGS